MEEKILFKGNLKINRLTSLFIILGLFIFLIGVIVCDFDIIALFRFALKGYVEILFVLGALVCWIIAFVFYMMMKNCQLVITDKKIFGQDAFGKNVSLPLDKISAVSTNMLQSLTITTSSGKISFGLITNGNEAWQIINDLLVERQK